jgi:hypothetical protein
MSSFKVFYMNQGGGGQWGAIPYKDYDLILLAESKVEKSGFSNDWSSKDSLPVMSVQTKEDNYTRVVKNIHDLDVLKSTVRPIITLTLKVTIDSRTVRIVFVHLKSASKTQADEALAIAAKELESEVKSRDDPILWIGDFNRAAEPPNLGNFTDSRSEVFSSGGQAKWNLDRAYITGKWGGNDPVATQVTKSGADHDHAGFVVDISY